MFTVLFIVTCVFLFVRAVVHHSTTRAYERHRDNKNFEIKLVRHFIGWEIVAKPVNYGYPKGLGYAFTKRGARLRILLWEWNLRRYERRSAKSVSLEEL